MVLCGDLEGWDGDEVGRRLKRKGISVYTYLIHHAIQKKLTQHCEAIMVQLKKKKILRTVFWTLWERERVG